MFCLWTLDAGQKLLDSLAETWDFFFCDVLSMLQAIFHPVQVHQQQSQTYVSFFHRIVRCSPLLLSVSGTLQGKEPSVRQLALLHFRNTIVLSVKLEDALSRPRARVPPSVTQMLLILQVGLQALLVKPVFLFCGTFCAREETKKCTK